MTQHAPSAEDLKAGFVHQTLTPIAGEPSYRSIDRLQTQCIRNAATVPLPASGGHSGCAGVAESPAMYLLRTGTHFNRPVFPGDQPLYPAGATDAQRENTLNTWKNRTRTYLTIQRTEILLLSMVERTSPESTMILMDLACARF